MPRLQAEGAHVLRGACDRSTPGSGGAEGVADSSALARAAAIRFPDLSKLQGREKIDALIDHITETAISRGELEELRIEAQVSCFEAQSELARQPSHAVRSKAAIDEFRRQARPDLAQRVDGARWLIDRCTEQINRMGGCEYDAASRCYTLLAGS